MATLVGVPGRGLIVRGRTRASALYRATPPVARVAWVVLILALLAMVIGPLVAPNDPNSVDVLQVYAGPSSAHLLGTDSLGHDLFSRLLTGARTAMLGPLAVAAVATLVGVALALTMAWRGGVADAVGARGLDVLLAFPGLLAAILSVAIFGQGLVAPAAALSLVYLPYVSRVVRAAALKERSLPYVAALTVQGLSSWRIVWRHIVPNIAPTIISQAVICASYAMMDLAAISFLGLGIQPPSSDWGLMVSDGQSAILAGFPQETLYAGACIVAVIVSLNIIGEHLGDDSERFDG